MQDTIPDLETLAAILQSFMQRPLSPCEEGICQAQIEAGRKAVALKGRLDMAEIYDLEAHGLAVKVAGDELIEAIAPALGGWLDKMVTDGMSPKVVMNAVVAAVAVQLSTVAGMTMDSSRVSSRFEMYRNLCMAAATMATSLDDMEALLNAQPNPGEPTN